MEPQHDEYKALLETLVQGLAAIASSVYDAQDDDGRIDWKEALSLGTDASAYAMRMLVAFRQLDKVSIKDFIDVLSNSDIVFQARD